MTATAHLAIALMGFASTFKAVTTDVSSRYSATYTITAEMEGRSTRFNLSYFNHITIMVATAVQRRWSGIHAKFVQF